MIKKLNLGTKISIIIGTIILICYVSVFSTILIQLKAKSINDSENLSKAYTTEITGRFEKLDI